MLNARDPLIAPFVVLAQLTAASPRLIATRVDSPPVLDGRLDDAAWRHAPAAATFTQKYPDEGATPTEHTTLRVVYDDEAVYVAFDCEQVNSPIVERLTRRGRFVESDWVSVAFGTSGDGKTAFEFLVNASGVLVDTLRFNDTETSEDWDENWDARAQVGATGWTAELRIPLHILRFPIRSIQSWDFQARRHVSTRLETDEWSYIPRSVGGEVSHYGKLDELRGLVASSPLELRPFVLGRIQRRDSSTVPLTGPIEIPPSSGTPARLAGGTNLSASAGLDIKWHPTYDLTLDATLNPDFAQVEADQLVLNLATFETYYPEKRPFFLEGVDIFTTPMQLVYTRRIGRSPDPPELRTDPPFGEVITEIPSPSTIYGAAKLTGRLDDRWSIGTLQALTARNDVPVKLANGSQGERILEPTTAFNAFRLKRDIGSNAHIGLLATSVTRAEPSAGHPLFLDPDTQETKQLCPSGATTPPNRRCFSDAYVGSLDWRWRSNGGEYVAGGQAAVSLLRNGAPREVSDGTTIDSGDYGSGVSGYFNKEGGKHWVGTSSMEFKDRKLDIRDFGYQARANNYRWRLELEYRELEKWWWMLESRARFEYYGRYNLDGLDIGSGYQFNVSGKLTNLWTFFTEVHWRPRWFDDREMGDGTALQRAGLLGYELELSTDPTRAVSFRAETQTQLLSNGFNFAGTFGLLFRAATQLDLEVLPTILNTFGEPRYITLGSNPNEYVFGKLAAQSIGTVLRATYTFTPRLTLQTYGQLFLSAGHFSDISSFQASAPRAIVHLDDLRSYPMALSQNPDFSEGVLNLNVVLRWEYNLGSTVYFVYTRAQAPATLLPPGEMGNLNLHSVRKAPAMDVFLLKLSYWWG